MFYIFLSALMVIIGIGFGVEAYKTHQELKQHYKDHGVKNEEEYERKLKMEYEERMALLTAKRNQEPAIIKIELIEWIASINNPILLEELERLKNKYS